MAPLGSAFRLRRLWRTTTAPSAKVVTLKTTIALVIVAAAFGCHEHPISPSGSLAEGRWSGGAACLSVTSDRCTLVVGCGHGVFARPTVQSDGTFDVDGTYRIEAG